MVICRECGKETGDTVDICQGCFTVAKVIVNRDTKKIKFRKKYHHKKKDG